MRKITSVVLMVFILSVFGCRASWAQYDGGGGSSMASSDLESGREEMQGVDSSMDVQPGDSASSIEERGMDVQSGDAIDSEGTGAH